MWVVSCATGTKCTAQRHNEYILHDSHAEVLARRGLIRVILSEITAKMNGDIIEKDVMKKTANSQALLVESKDCKDEAKERHYQVDPNVEFHFYISDSPCGDASIYSVPSDGTTKNNNGPLYTGAKVIVSEATKVNATDCGGNHQLLLATEPNASNEGKSKEGSIDEKNITESSRIAAAPVFAREEIQVLGKLRIKSGRSNLPAHMRSHSHSCSDKLASWSILGLQGGLLTKFLHPPIIPLASVIVSKDARLHRTDDYVNNEHEEQHQSQTIALQRAIIGRVRNVWESLGAHKKDDLPSWKPSIPTVHVVPETFVSGKAAMLVPPKNNNLAGKKRMLSGDSEENKCKNENDAEISQVVKNNDGCQIQKAVPPCGVSFNWNQNEDIEIIVGARGIKHGKKPKTTKDIEKLASRLSRARLLRDYSLHGENINRTANTTTKRERKPSQTALPKSPAPNDYKFYHQIKQDSASREWIALKTRILTHDGSPLAGWLRCVPTNADLRIEKVEEDNR